MKGIFDECDFAPLPSLPYLYTQKIGRMDRSQNKTTMKKYTIKEFAEGKKAVKIENEEQWNKLNKVHKLTCKYHGVWEYDNKQRYSETPNWYIVNGWEVLEFSQLDFEDEFVVGSWYEYNGWFLKFQTIIKGNTFIASETIDPDGVYENRENDGFTCGDADKTKVLLTDLSEIQQYLPSNHPDLIKKDTFVLPEKWILKITPENKAIVNEWKIKQTYNDDLFKNPEYTLVNSCGSGGIMTDPNDKRFITFEQFQQYVLKTTKTMEKEIIGYKLKDVKYLEATKGLIKSLGGSYGDNLWWDENACNNLREKGWNFAEGNKSKSIAQIMKEAGVLDLWFEKVYAPEFKKDDYVTVVSIGTYDYNSSSGDTRPVIGKTYKIYNVSTTYVDLDTPGGIIAIKSSDLRKATEDEVKKAQIQLPTINGKQCVDNGDKTITCGCTTKSFDWILGVDYAMGEEIDISGTGVSDKEIRQIVEYIKNK